MRERGIGQKNMHDVVLVETRPESQKPIHDARILHDRSRTRPSTLMMQWNTCCSAGYIHTGEGSAQCRTCCSDVTLLPIRVETGWHPTCTTSHGAYSISTKSVTTTSNMSAADRPQASPGSSSLPTRRALRRRLRSIAWCRGQSILLEVAQQGQDRGQEAFRDYCFIMCSTRCGQ